MTKPRAPRSYPAPSPSSKAGSGRRSGGRSRAASKSDAQAGWKAGHKLVHPFNADLGVGVVTDVDGRFLTVVFPEAGRELRLSTEASGLRRLVVAPGAPIRVLETREEVVVAECLGDTYRLEDGRILHDSEIWPTATGETPIDRLASLRVDSARAFRNRLEGLELEALRGSGGLGSFLGGRIELFPHQLHTALRAVERDPVRWLLADEVGLGKTIEACLVVSALVRTGRARRALVVAPGTLAVQWLGELWRKFHQVFVLLDRERIESVETTVGEGANPFEVVPFAVMTSELLASDPALCQSAVEAGLDCVVVDEAHRLARSEIEERLGPVVRSCRHALLLTATPLQADREGFHRLLSLLHPEAFPSFEDFQRALEAGDAVLPCTSAVRRADVGGLPPRVPRPIDVPALETGVDGADATEAELRRDPRVRWLAEQTRGWKAHGEKALVFASAAETVETLARVFESLTRTRVAIFHEGLSAAKRDLEVAAFRESPLPLLISSEAGGEGRNFQFCTRIVHFDLPRDPVELEQRIGRLDRIGRDRPVEIVYFRPEGATPDVARLYEQLDLFARPAAGLDSALAEVPAALDAAAAGEAFDPEAWVARIAELRERAGRDWVRVVYADAYRPELADEVLARVPDDLEEKTRAFCIPAAELLGLDVVEKGGAAQYYFELGSGATVDRLVGVEDGQRFLGTFDREEAVRREELDFFASGHPLVEGLLLELEDGPRGRAALVELEDAPFEGAGLACVHRGRAGEAFELSVVEADGTPRPEWSEPLVALLRESHSGRVEDWGITDPTRWAEGVRALAGRVPGDREVVAVAFFRTR